MYVLIINFSVCTLYKYNTGLKLKFTKENQKTFSGEKKKLVKRFILSNFGCLDLNIYIF